MKNVVTAHYHFSLPGCHFSLFNLEGEVTSPYFLGLAWPLEFIGKLLIQMRGILKFLEEILGLISGSLSDDQGGFTYMTDWLLHNTSSLARLVKITIVGEGYVLLGSVQFWSA